MNWLWNVPLFDGLKYLETEMLVIIITWFVNMIIWGLLVPVKVKDLNLAHNHLTNITS